MPFDRIGAHSGIGRCVIDTCPNMVAAAASKMKKGVTIAWCIVALPASGMGSRCIAHALQHGKGKTAM